MLRFKQTAHFQKHIFSKKKLAKYKSLAFSRCLFRRNCLKVRAFSCRHHLPLSVRTLPEKPLGRELIHEIVCAPVGFCYLGCLGEFCFNLLDLPLEVNLFRLAGQCRESYLVELGSGLAPLRTNFQQVVSPAVGGYTST
jgi:hypothetical protein